MLDLTQPQKLTIEKRIIKDIPSSTIIWGARLGDGDTHEGAGIVDDKFKMLNQV